MRNIYRFEDFLTEKKKSEMTPDERARADAATSKAIATKGHDEIRKDQLAAIYMIAKNKLREIGLKGVDQSEFVAYVDLKKRTYNETLKKVENILSDISGAKRKHNTSDSFKYTELVTAFEKMTDDELQDLALQALEGGKKRAEKYTYEERISKNSAGAEPAKLINAISDFIRSGVAADKAIAKIAKEKGLDTEKLKAIWDGRK